MEEKIYGLLRERDSEGLISLIRSDLSLGSFTDSRGLSLVVLATYFRLREVVEFILARRAPFDIYEATVAGRVRDVETFLDKELHLMNSFSGDGFTPLGLASYFCQAEVAALLLERGAAPDIPSENSFRVYPIHSAVAANCVEIVQMLIKRGADVNVKQQGNVTPLHSAAHNGSAQIAALLISGGADKDVLTADGKSPADMAREVGSDEVLSLLA